VIKNRYYEWLFIALLGGGDRPSSGGGRGYRVVRRLRNVIVGELIVADLEFLSVTLVPFGLAFGFRTFEHRYVVFGRGRAYAASE
jgi:hypothetical protein